MANTPWTHMDVASIYSFGLYAEYCNYDQDYTLEYYEKQDVVAAGVTKIYARGIDRSGARRTCILHAPGRVSDNNDVKQLLKETQYSIGKDINLGPVMVVVK